MNIITLNTWGGRAGKDALLAFFDKYQDVDVFCLQEIWFGPHEGLEGRSAGGCPIDHSEILIHGVQEISAHLPHHIAYFRPHYRDYGLMMLVKKDLDLLSEGDVFVHKEPGYEPQGELGNHARNLQWATVATPQGERSILNFHGLWNGQGKTDSEDRLVQSDRMLAHLQTIAHPLILCGDFNLLPDTQSLQKLEEFGLRNLVKDYGITSTRTSFYTKPERFADYILVSKEVEVKDFKVLPEEVSDHAALYLEYN